MNRFIKLNRGHFIKGNGPQKPLSTMQRNELVKDSQGYLINFDRLNKLCCKALRDEIMKASL